MKLVSALSLAFLFVAAGCRSSSRTAADDNLAASSGDTSRVYSMAIHVLVDGRDMGVIPTTVRVRRSFGTQEVSLWQAGKELRIYEVEINNTTQGDQTMQGFWSTSTIDGATFDSESLPKDGNVYMIPYSPNPIRIEDRAHGLTLLVSD